MALSLADSVKRVREEASAGLLELEARRRRQLLRAKAMLWDVEYEALPEAARLAFPGYWEKFTALMLEHEQTLRMLVARGIDRPEWHCRRCGAVSDSFLTDGCSWCEAAPRVRMLRDQLHRRGWAAIRSKHLLDEVVLVVRDASVEVPPERRGCVRYSLAELGLLRGAGPEMLRRVHEAKRRAGES